MHLTPVINFFIIIPPHLEIHVGNFLILARPRTRALSGTWHSQGLICYSEVLSGPVQEPALDFSEIEPVFTFFLALQFNLCFWLY
jgi:hypothetical protein